jgi:hypothetical protein
MHYHMYCKNHAQDVTVAATYMSWNIWVLHLDSILDIINTSVVQYLNF